MFVSLDLFLWVSWTFCWFQTFFFCIENVQFYPCHTLIPTEKKKRAVITVVMFAHLNLTVSVFSWGLNIKTHSYIQSYMLHFLITDSLLTYRSPVNLSLPLSLSLTSPLHLPPTCLILPRPSTLHGCGGYHGNRKGLERSCHIDASIRVGGILGLPGPLPFLSTEEISVNHIKERSFHTESPSDQDGH